jgi:hypothetical protein
MQSGQNVHLRSKTYHFIFMDIVGFSYPSISAEDQAKMISSLNKLVQESELLTATETLDAMKKASGADYTHLQWRDRHLYLNFQSL